MPYDVLSNCMLQFNLTIILYFQARIKAKATPVSMSSGRSDQRLEGMTTAAESMRLPVAPSAIRYPVPLHHFPLQSPHGPAPYPFVTATPAGHLSYMPYLMQHPLISPPWNQPQQVFQDPNFVSSMMCSEGKLE